MAWKDWKDEVPEVRLTGGSFAVKPRSSRRRQGLYQLLTPIELELVATRELFQVPSGFLCDGSSVPVPLWAALDATPPDLLLPGCIHDATYRANAALVNPVSGKRRSIDRYQADLMHIAVSRRMRVGRRDQAKIFFALRVGGRFAFHEKRMEWDGS